MSDREGARGGGGLEEGQKGECVCARAVSVYACVRVRTHM